MNAETIARALKARRSGSTWLAPCPAHDDRNPSLAITERDGRTFVHCHAGCSQTAVLDALRARGLWSDGAKDDATGSPPARWAKRRDNQNARRAIEIWRATEVADETVVATYLHHRGIAPPVPPTLRYAPRLLHSRTNLTLPAMVAVVQAADRRPVAIHRTFLRIDGRGRAPLTDGKMMLGPCAGGAVRFACASEELAIAEGIETALSYQQMTGQPTWAALSAAGIKALRLPEIVRRVVIAADRGEAGERAAHEAAERFASEGRQAEIVLPPSGCSDFNDALQAREAAA